MASTIKDFRSQIQTRKFCFCLPVRLGVFVVSLLTMTAGSILGAIGWMQVVQFRTHPVELGDEIAAYVHASIFSLLGLLSIFGFVGSLVRLRGLVIAYSVGIAIHLGLSIASGIFNMYTMFKPNPQSAIEACMNAVKDSEDLDETRRICQTGSAIAKGIIVAIYVITWLLQIYAFFIIERYAEQLEEEEMAKLAAIMPQQPNHPNSYVGYPHRFSYGYSERGYDGRRSYYYDDRYPAYGPQQGAEQKEYPHPQQQHQQRPMSQEYAFTLPPQTPLTAGRNKDASNMA
ncbi:hypothetical protein FA15DRAFT_704850 [Coprinopsis marcescibilis]|jgi:hypothetical protein|uniref:Uncharacterized protein n=1 Tax=Coprinopsis marcescibilis TaxID=230819 RepID=A0A5C3L775_COPMA|nr:hypothetical protein FA15DRAFT_704850 [Coprinopsis marcescibilis]